MNNRLNVQTDSLAIAQLKENSNWYMILGILLVILGILAIAFSFFSTIFSVIYVGTLLTALGFFEIFKSFKISRWSGFFLHLFLGVLYVVGGLFVIFYPVINALSLTMLLAVFFIVSGILKIIFSFAKNTVHKGWLALNGVLALILGVLIIKQLPLSGLWVIGTFVGIDMMFTGWTWIMLSIAAKNYKTEHIK